MRPVSTGLVAGALCLSIVALGRQQPTPLSTGKLITPQGRQTPVGSFPANMALSPDGRYVVVTNTGFRQFLSVLSAADGSLVSQTEVGGERAGQRQGLYYGLAFGPAEPDGATLYASRGGEEQVAVYRLDAAGRLTDTGRRLESKLNVPDRRLRNVVAGIALSGDGRRLFVADNNTHAFTGMRGSVTEIDTETGRQRARVKLPGFPFAVAALTRGPAAGSKVYVSSERDGVLTVVDPGGAREPRDVRVGSHPIGLLLDRDQARLFVANAASDTVSIVRTSDDRVRATVLLRPDDLRGLPGATPTGLALSPDETRLYVTLADMNALAVVELPAGKLLGYVPVGWYPTAVVVSPDGSRLFVANAKGIAERNPNARAAGPDGRWGQYIENIIEGTVSTVETPSPEQLRALTARTIANNRIAAARAARLRNPGIKHVIYVIKENRTYDQVFGDMAQGNGDPSVCMFPREVTPNQHALAERFGLFDNFYVCAEVSADGWNWSTSGMAGEYTARNAPYNYSGRGRVYDFEGQNNGSPVDLLGLPDVATAPSGYIWDHCLKHRVSFRNYGFFLSSAGPGDKGPDGKPLAVDNTPNKRALVGRTDSDFRQFDMSYADSEAWLVHGVSAPRQMKAYGSHAAPSRYTEWKREFDGYVRRGDLPRFVMVRLPRNHTAGTSPGQSSPRAMAADNDYAVGQLVEAVSKSPFWRSTAIFVVEDDAQNGFDHVDAHRSCVLVISPFVKAGVRSAFCNTDSVLRTMEMLLGMPPMNQYDAVAPPLDVFADRRVNLGGYEAILPARSIIAEVNRPTAYRARDSARLNFHDPDSVPDELLNDILWHAVMGRRAPKPPIRYTLRPARP